MVKNKQNFVRNMARDVRDKAVDAKEKVVEVKDATQDLIKKYPFTSVAIAAAAGAIVALGINAIVKKEEKPFLRRFKDYFD